MHVVWNPYEIVHVRVENFWKKNIFPQKSGNWTKNGPNWNFLDLLENLVINFFSVWSMMNVYVFAAFLHKFHIWEKLISWCMGQNALRQSDCMFLISTTSQEKKDQIAWVFLCWCRFKKSKNWLIFFFFFLAGHGQKMALVTLKLAISEEGTDRINSFSVWWCKFR